MYPKIKCKIYLLPLNLWYNLPQFLQKQTFITVSLEKIIT